MISDGQFRLNAFMALASALGAGRSDAVVTLMTEGYHLNNPNYGWCADGVTWSYEQAGSRSTALNRISINGSKPFGPTITWMVEKAGTPLNKGARQVPLLADGVVMPRKDGDHIGLYLCDERRASTLLMDKELQALYSNGSQTRQILAKLAELVSRGSWDECELHGDAFKDQSGRVLPYITLDANGWGSRVCVTRRGLEARGTSGQILSSDSRIRSLVNAGAFAPYARPDQSMPQNQGRDVPQFPPTRAGDSGRPNQNRVNMKGGSLAKRGAARVAYLGVVKDDCCDGDE